MKKSLFALPLLLTACTSQVADQPLSQQPDLPAEQIENQELELNQEDTVSELQIEDIQVGDGVEAKTGDTVDVHYTGWLTNGTKFDSSVDRGQPFSFTLGEGRVIQGWDEGVVGMKVGGKRKLTIPSDMAYGDTGIGVIPPGATLVFEVELLEVNPVE